MRKLSTTLLLLSLLMGSAFCQKNPEIRIGRDKTSFIILYNTRPESYKIGGQKGTVDCEEQPVNSDTIRILGLQAARENFTSTNLLIVCADTIMEFTLRYDADPAVTRYPFRYSGRISLAKTIHTPVIIDTLSQNGIVIQRKEIEQLRGEQRSFNRSVSMEGLFLFLDNVALDTTGHHLFKLRLRNTTAVNYVIEYIKFTVENEKNGWMQKQGKTSQDSYPPYLSAPDNISTIKAGEQQELIYAIQKLPLNRGEQLSIIIQEQAENSRGRTLRLRIPALALNNKSKILRL